MAGALVMLPRCKPNFDVLWIFDAVMALTGRPVDFAAKSGKDFPMVFVFGVHIFSVWAPGKGIEFIVPMRLQADRSGLTVIFLLHSVEWQRYMQAAVGCHFFV